MRILPIKTTLVIVTLVAFMKAPDAMPAFKDYKVLDFQTIPGVLDFKERRASAAPIEDEQLRLHPDRDAASYKVFRLNDPAHALDHFFEALQRTEFRQPGAITRIVHYGDSPTTADMITGDARRLLQSRFGDGGHGFCLLGKPWAWYDHNGVSLQSTGWTIDPASQTRLKDGLYGLGGVSFSGVAGAHTNIVLRDSSHTRLQVSFLKRPDGGVFQILEAGKALGTVDTKGPTVEPGYFKVDLPPDSRHLEIRVIFGNVRAFGVSFEKTEPGVQYDSLGLNGANVSVLSRTFDERHWTEQLRRLQPDLVIINYGTNESGYASFVDVSFGKELTEAVRRVRAAVPGASILVMSPMDRGRRDAGGEIGTLPTIPRLVTIQQRVAMEMGCGFFNTFLAMGGPGTMGQWYQAEPRLVGGDFIHPMPAGAKIVGNLLYQALFDGYSQFKVRRVHERFANMKPAAPK